MKTAILFDLDGTLLDTLEDLTDAVNHTMEDFGYPTHSRENVRRFVGNGAARLIQLSVPAGKDWQVPLEQFRQYYAAHCQIKTAAYPGIPQALEALAAHPIAIVSNKPDAATKRLCAEYFPGIHAQGEHPGCPRKPAPDMVHNAMAQLGADRCIYVGDSEVDVVTAANAGVPCLSVLWGFRNRPEILAAGGRHFCESPGEMPAQLEKMIKELEENGQ